MRPILNRLQRDKKIIELYEQGYPVAEICSEVGASATTVTDRINQHNKSKEPPVVSVRSQAFELFKKDAEKISLADVAAKLDLSADETQSLYAEFQRLKGLNEYVMLNFKTEGDINEFLDCYNEFQELRITPAIAMEALAMARSVASIERQREIASQELKDIQSTIRNEKIIRNNLRDENKYLNSENEYLKSEIELLKMNKRNLENDNSELKNVEQEYKNSEFHQTVRKIATEVATRVWANKSMERIEARVAIAKVIRQNPELLPVLCPSEGYYNFDLERNYKVLLDKTMDEGHREFQMMVLPSVVSKLCAGIDEYHKNNKKQEGGTTGENSKA